jgi:hypothetical protein
VAARLEIHEQRGASRAIAGIVERKHFGMRFAGARVAALADDDAIGRHDNRADQRIGRGDAFSAAGVKQGAPHEAGVGRHFHHFSVKIAST